MPTQPAPVFPVRAHELYVPPGGKVPRPGETGTVTPEALAEMRKAVKRAKRRGILTADEAGDELDILGKMAISLRSFDTVVAIVAQRPYRLRQRITARAKRKTERHNRRKARRRSRG